jgi:hypothetical protein
MQIYSRLPIHAWWPCPPASFPSGLTPVKNLGFAVALNTRSRIRRIIQICPNGTGKLINGNTHSRTEKRPHGLQYALSPRLPIASSRQCETEGRLRSGRLRSKFADRFDEKYIKLTYSGSSVQVNQTNLTNNNVLRQTYSHVYLCPSCTLRSAGI